jgi:hypothetical protein
MKKAVFLLGMFLIVSICSSQNYVGREEPFTKERLTGGTTTLGLTPSTARGLLDPSRFSMRQSYSVSYITSGAYSDMTGLYLNRLQYNFAIPITLQVDLGYFHKPMALMDRESPPGTNNQAFTVPRVGLTFQPSKNFLMSFEYFHMPAGFSNSLMPFDDYYFSPLPGFGRNPSPKRAQ